MKRADQMPANNGDLGSASVSTGRVVIVAMTVDFGTEHGTTYVKYTPIQYNNTVYI